MFLSSIVFSEYALRNNPRLFPFDQVRQISFDFPDAAKAGKIFEFLLNAFLYHSSDFSKKDS